MSAAPITIQFIEWNCGHHCQCPKNILCHSVEQANLILQAISHAISQPGSVRAAVFNETHGTLAYITDDYCEQVKHIDSWGTRQTLYVGTSTELEELQSDALKEAVDWIVGGPMPVWDGLSYLNDFEAVTTLSLAELDAILAPISGYEDRHAKCDLPPALKPLSGLLIELRAEAAQQAVDAGEYEPKTEGGTA